MIWRLHGDRRVEFGQRTQILGVLNVTPDSFYDGGRYVEPLLAAEQALRLEAEGADIIDIGGESSRPPVYGEVAPVCAEEECHRVVPVVEAIRRQSDVPLSVDTVKAEVARRALSAGADIINDISAFEYESGAMADVASQAAAPVILMHRRGTPADMQQNTHYDDLTGEIRTYLTARLQFAHEHGIRADRVAVDPGIGFGKSVEGNRELIRRAAEFGVGGCPVVVGASRKSFIWKPMGISPEGALEGSLAAAVLAVVHGAQALRVHDVEATVRAVRAAEAIESASDSDD
ncbi:MAG: dihydropteroate synthase [Candidatus Latescibacteria bacterium]|nr:dihydropteroate synthase [Gemmatimonadaceae bacterium]MDP6016235.1 dihydropteroate synthase [Candidatus Latescibacterota bacterium]